MKKHNFYAGPSILSQYTIKNTADAILDFAEELGFFYGLRCPYAGVEIGGLGVEEVHRSHGELQACASSEEKYAVALGHLKKFLDKSNSLVYYCLKLLAAV